jgi:hypothetical protein
MSDNGDLSIGIGASVDQASINAAKEALKGIGSTAAKTAETIERSKAFDNAAKEFARMAVAENDAAKAAANLAEEFLKLGASDAEIEKITRSIDKEIEAIQRADAAAAEKAQNDARRAAQDSELRRSRADDANDRLDNTRAGVGIAGDAASAINTIGGALGVDVSGISSILELTEAIPLLKVAAEGLPDTFRAAGEALGLAKAAQDASTAAAGAASAAETTQAAVTGTLATSSGGAAVGIGAMLVPLLPLAAAGLAVGAALAGLAAIIGGLQAETAKANEAIKTQYDAQTEIEAFQRSGATVGEAYKRQAELQDIIADATTARNEAEAKAAEDFASRSGGLFGDLAARLGDVFNVKSNDEGYASVIEAAEKAAEEAQPKLDALNKTISEGGFAADKADDASKAQKKIAEDSVRAQEQAQEKAVRAQEQAASKQAAAQETAAREAEAAAEKIQAAQEAIGKSAENYANKQIDTARQNAQKMQDIQQGARDKAEDTDKKYYQDTVKLAEDARNAEIDAQRKFAQAELQADKDANRTLEDLRDDAITSEQDALSSRNFLAAARVREGLEKSNSDVLKDVERAREDRQTAADIEAQDRYIELTKARVDRADALKQERLDNQAALNRQIRDARTAQDRQAQDAQIAFARENAEKQAHLNELLGIDQAYYAQRSAMAQAAANGGSTQTGIGTGTGSASSGGVSGPGGFTPGSFGGLQPITTNNSRATVNNIQISGDDTRVLRLLRETGVIQD